MTLGQIQRAPGYVLVAKAIEEEITSGRLKIGEYLPTEVELAEQLGVNRSTVREGIRALESASLVTRAGGKKLKVSAPQPKMIADVNARALRLLRVSFLDLWETMMELEPLAAEFAAGRISEDLVQAISDNTNALADRIDDDAAIIKLDIEFHGLIAKATQNTALSIACTPLHGLLLSATTDLYTEVPQARHRMLHAHQAIVAAIRNGDATEARVWMARHIQDFKRGYEVAGFDLGSPIGLRS